MNSLSPNLRGIVLMVLATGVFVCNDTLMKLATEGLPPFEVVFIRQIFGTIWCLPLLAFTGTLKHLGQLRDGWTLLRSVLELLSVLLFIVVLANMPIADTHAIMQTAPMLMLLGIAVFFREHIGWVRMGLIAVGFLGALLVAQPSGSGYSIFAVLAFVSALLTGGRDVVLRLVPSHVPALIVTFSTLLVVTIGSLIAMLLFGHFEVPTMRHLLLLGASGFFLMLGHLCIYLAYKTAAPGVVAPFYYMFTIWAVISGFVVFHTLPNALALLGIALIIGGGVSVVLLDERKRRLTIVA